MRVSWSKALSLGFVFALAQPNLACLAAEKSISQNISGTQSIVNTYILGPGDSFSISFLKTPELNASITIGPDGVVYLPRIRALYVEGLTISELQAFLTEQYSKFLKSPDIYLKPLTYRAVRVYVGGEVLAPGYYSISKNTENSPPSDRGDLSVVNDLRMQGAKQSFPAAESSDRPVQFGSSENSWPKLFDALRAARGATPYSDFSEVTVIRNQPKSRGGGKIQAKIDFLKLVAGGDESVNINLFDGDYIRVAKSDKVLRDQLIATSRTNISPDFIGVFVVGQVKSPGTVQVPQGSTLNQSIASAGGPQLLKGSVEFLRFNPDGTSDRRRFSYNSTSKADSFKNPILMQGDIVRINESFLSAGVEVLNLITGPAVGVYSVYSIFKGQ